MATRQESLLGRVPPFAYESAQAFDVALEAKNAYRYDKNELYYRDGFPALAQVEDQLAGLVGAELGHVLLTNTGMAAIVAAIEVGHPTAGDKVLHAFQSYSKTNEYITGDLRERGVKTVGVDIGSLASITAAIERERPKILVFETVSNGTEMAILDAERFLALPVLKEVNPLIILDNTIPTDSNLPLASLIKKTGLRVIGVESGTKSYALNQELAGILFTYDESLLEQLHKIRRRGIGTVNPSVVETLLGVIPPTKEQFDRENKAIARNTRDLALACSQAPGSFEKFVVLHPNLPDHPQSDLANSLYPDGCSPVFFIQPAQPNITAEIIVRSLEKSLLDHDLIPGRDFYFAQSFGFNRIGISWDKNAGCVRIAGGLENPEQLAKVQRALQAGLAAVNNGMVRFGLENEFAIALRPASQEDCGQECLSMLGYDGYQIVAAGGLVTPWDIEGIPGVKEITTTVQKDGYDPDTPYLVIGRKRNGRDHFYLRVGNVAINPEEGKPQPVEEYEGRDIAEVLMVYQVPLGPLIKE